MMAPVEAATQRVVEAYSLIFSGTDPIKVRTRVADYLEMMFAGGQTNADQLAVLGLRYLKEKDAGSQGYTGL
jgi:hypothetical protein